MYNMHKTAIDAFWVGVALTRVSVYTTFFFFSSRRRHTRYWRDWSSDVCSSDLKERWHQDSVCIFLLGLEKIPRDLAHSFPQPACSTWLLSLPPQAAARQQGEGLDRKSVV